MEKRFIIVSICSCSSVELAGDLTPMNVLVKEVDGRFGAKLTDFGLSKSKMSKSSKASVGTPGYKAPDLVQGELSGAVDVFSFGGVLVYLFGEDHLHPFDEFDDYTVGLKMLDCQRNGEELRVPELQSIESTEIRKIATECLSIRSAARPTAQDLLDRFSEMCGLSGGEQIGNAAVDMMLKVHMRTLNMLVEEVASLKERLKEKDVEANDMDMQIDFLMDKYMDSL